jgi:hypothetical protein
MHVELTFPALTIPAPVEPPVPLQQRGGAIIWQTSYANLFLADDGTFSIFVTLTALYGIDDCSPVPAALEIDMQKTQVSHGALGHSA